MLVQQVGSLSINLCPAAGGEQEGISESSLDRGQPSPTLTAGLTRTPWKLLTLNPARSFRRGVSVLSTVQRLSALRPARSPKLHNDGQNQERKWMDSENSDPLNCVDF